VPAGGGDLERPPGALLTAHVAEVGPAARLLSRLGRPMGGRRVAEPAKVRDRLGEVRNRHRLDTGERDLGSRLGRADDAAQTRLPGALGGDEGAGNRAEATVERQLADRGVAAERVRRELPGRGEHRQGDGHVEARPLLAESGGCKVDGQPAARPLELGGGDPAADAVLRLLAGSVGEADDREGGRAALQVRLDLDAARVEADESVGDRAGEHVVTLGDKM